MLSTVRSKVKGVIQLKTEDTGVSALRATPVQIKVFKIDGVVNFRVDDNFKIIAQLVVSLI